MKYFVILITTVSLAWSQGSLGGITGRVTDKTSGNPIGNAMVNVVGTLIGTTASDDGRFTVSVASGPVQLSVRRIGYRRLVAPVAENQDNVTIALEKDVLKLEEVVVTGTATTMERAHAATATQTIGGEEVARVPAFDLTSALQGKVVGARINMNKP